VYSVGRSTEPVTNSIGMRLVRIEAGTFTMGQDGPPLEDYLRQKRFGEMHKDIDRIDFDEKPAHQVTITQPFHIGVTEVTVAQFRQFAPEGKNTADGYGYLAITQTRDGRIQLITSKDHYVFNLAWVKALPPEPRR
jgi:formylglycine-generating enzyme required for sulfatase activity